MDLTVEIVNRGSQPALVRELSIDIEELVVLHGAGKHLRTIALFSDFDNCVEVPAFDAIRQRHSVEVPVVHYGLALTASAVTKTRQRFRGGSHQLELLVPRAKEKWDEAYRARARAEDAAWDAM